MTPRERVCPNGDRPKRTTKEKGFWRTGQKKVEVYDVTQRRLGYKRNLAFYDEKKRKTTWLMTEYTTTDPNLPVGNGTKLNNFVLCKIYKKIVKQLSANQDIGSNDDAMTSQTRMNTGHSPITNNTSSTQPQLVNSHLMTVREISQSLCGSLACDDQQIRSTLIALDEFLNGDSSSTEMEAEQLPDYRIDTIQSLVTSTNGTPDSTADQVPQPDEDFFESDLTKEFPQLFNFSPDDQVPEPANNVATTPVYDEDFFDCSFPQLEDYEAILDKD